MVIATSDELTKLRRQVEILKEQNAKLLGKVAQFDEFANDWDGPTLEQTRGAAHMLHEQAHGDMPWQTCDREPCRDMWREHRLTGPAPRVLPLVGA